MRRFAFKLQHFRTLYLIPHSKKKQGESFELSFGETSEKREREK